MTGSEDSETFEVAGSATLPGLAITGMGGGREAVLAAAMLAATLAASGENVAAMVPVETGIDDPCDPGSAGALMRWAAGHMDDPRQVTPFALEADRSAMHAADASGTLLHSAAFDRAREALSDGRSVFVMVDAIGLLDPITPSLTTLDLIVRWKLSAAIAAPINRWTIGNVRILYSLLLSRNIRIAGVILSAETSQDPDDLEGADAVRDTLAALLNCPVVVAPTMASEHDRAELVAAGRACGVLRLAP